MSVFGKPDLTFKKRKVAIFVDNEFFPLHSVTAPILSCGLLDNKFFIK
ncbi:hypothetical protein [Cloacibacterium normanense]